MWTVLFYPVDTVLFIHNVFSMVLREADLLFQNFHRILKLPVISISWVMLLIPLFTVE